MALGKFFTVDFDGWKFVIWHCLLFGTEELGFGSYDNGNNI